MGFAASSDGSRVGASGGAAENVADAVVDSAGDRVLLTRGGLEAFDERAAFEIGEHFVELVGDLFEFGEQVALLVDGLVDCFGRRWIWRRCAGFGFAHDRRHRQFQTRHRRFAVLSAATDRAESWVVAMIRCRRSSAWRGCSLRALFLSCCQLGLGWSFDWPTAFVLLAGEEAAATRGALAPLFQQVGHRRHAVGRDVGEDLEHLGPLVEVADADLGIAGGLLEQVFADFVEIRQAAAVRLLGVGLPFDLAARFRFVEFLRRHVAQPFVRFVKLQLAVADFECLAMPFGELLGDPDRVLLGVEDVEDVGGGVDSLSIREIIGGEQPQLDRLRLDAERLGGEGALHVERGFFMAADGEHRFAFGWLLDHVAGDASPAHADVFHAEVVVGSHVED